MNNVYSNHAEPGLGTEFILNPKPHFRRLAGILPRLMLGLALLPLAASGQANYATPYTFTTIAGNPGYGSADGAKNAAQFAFPSSMAVDRLGHLYVADMVNSTIREVTQVGTNWVVTTLAGLAGCTGTNDGTGSAARFYYPNGVAADNAGNLYVADTQNATIREIAPVGTNWVVTTLAGLAGCPGTNDGTGSAARLNGPGGVGVDTAGNVYVADTANHAIRKITPSGASWLVTTLAGLAGNAGSANGTGKAARFYFPYGVTVDTNGNVYVADLDNYTIRKVTAAGTVTTLAGQAGIPGSANGTGSAAQFNSPYGVAVDTNGNVYVADAFSSMIRKVTAAGTVTTLAGNASEIGTNNGTGSAAWFQFPCGVTVDSAGNVYVADSGNNTIRKVTPAGVVTTLTGLAVGSIGSANGTGSTSRFNFPAGVAVDTNGNVYVADFQGNTIREVMPSGTNWVVTTLAGLAGSAGSVNGTGSAARFNGPIGVAVDSAGNLYVADRGNDTIRKVTPVGNSWVVTTVAGLAGYFGSANGTNSAARFYNPEGVAVDSAGNLYVTDFNNNTIREVTPVGTNWVVTTLAGLAGSAGSANGMNSAARFNGPDKMAVDSAGNLYVADYNNSTIRKVAPVGTNWVVTTLAGLAGNLSSADGTNSTARFFNPEGVAVDSAGNVYVADWNNCTIRKVTPVGTNWVVTTVAGRAFYLGDIDGTGSAARFCGPFGLAADSAGNLYVADMDNFTIRRGFPANSVPAPMLQRRSLSAGQFGFGITGLSGLPLNIEASSDLVNWQVIGTCCLSGGTNCVICPDSSSGVQFFRTQVR